MRLFAELPVSGTNYTLFPFTPQLPSSTVHTVTLSRRDVLTETFASRVWLGFFVLANQAQCDALFSHRYAV